jgi:hypothetical protein
MATDADANKAIIIVRNISHLRDLAFEVSTPFGVGSSQIPKATLGRLPGGGGAILLTSTRLNVAQKHDQQPRQMLLILRSTSLFSALISASPLFCGPVMSVADPAPLPEPVVTPLPVLTPAPDDCAVPAELVPGAGGDASLEAFAAPLGSSPALFNPPGAAGPGGTPLVPCEPAPAEPALGEPAALPLLPADEPPALWPNDATDDIRIMIAATAAAADASFIGNLLFGATTTPRPLFLTERFPCQIIHSHPLDARSDQACAN